MHILHRKWAANFMLLTTLLISGTASQALLSTQVAPASVFSVTKPTDTNDGVCDADCSLREAILAANAQPGVDSVIVPAGIYTLTISGTDEDAGATGDLDIIDDLSLTGAGAEATVIDGGGIDRVIDVTGTLTPTVLIGELSVRGGNSNDAAGILSQGTLTITNSGVISNTGHGLVNRDGLLTVISSTVSDNTSVGIGTTRGVTTIANSVIAYNTCSGLHNFQGNLLVVDSQISNNQSLFPCSQGGGIYTYGGIVTVSHTVVSSNSSNSVGQGGGLYSDFGGGTFNISESQFLSNAAYEGGGAYVYSGFLNITDTLFSGNSSVQRGGAILHGYQPSHIHNSTFINNLAGWAGGGIYSFDALTITSSLFVGNKTSSGGGGGAALYGCFSVTNSTFAQNQAYVYGGGIFFSTNCYGAFVNHLNNLTISENIVHSDNFGTSEGGGLYVYTDSVVSLSNVLLAGNTDLGGEAPDCGGTLTSLGYNLIQDTTGCVISGALTGVITGTDPLLGLLQDNGGTTLTQMPLSGSPAIDAGNPAVPGSDKGACDIVDQRDYLRPVDGDGNGIARCDIGAVETGSRPNVGLTLYLPLLER